MVSNWSADQVSAYRNGDRLTLQAFASKFAELSGALTETVSPKDKIATEMRDGLQITGLRAAHMVEIMDAALAINDAKTQAKPELLDQAKTHLQNAQAITAAAAIVVARREAAYRYPLAWSSSGDEAGTPGAIATGTQYTYRYLSRVHRLYYWTRPEGQLDALLNNTQAVSVNQRILQTNAALQVTLNGFSNGTVNIDYGDGANASTLAPHTYATAGLYHLHVQAVGDLNVDTTDKIGVAAQRLRVRLGQFAVQSPSGAAVLNGILPAMIIGVDASSVVFGPDIDDDGVPEANSVVQAALSGGSTAPIDVSWPLVNGGSGQALANITLYGCTLTFTGLSVSGAQTLTLQTELATADIVNLLVELAAFSTDGAQKTVAAVLGYTVDTLPARVTVSISAQNVPPS
jgi:hypothetical protein